MWFVSKVFHEILKFLSNWLPEFIIYCLDLFDTCFLSIPIYTAEIFFAPVVLWNSDEIIKEPAENFGSRNTLVLATGGNAMNANNTKDNLSFMIDDFLQKQGIMKETCDVMYLEFGKARDYESLIDQIFNSIESQISSHDTIVLYGFSMGGAVSLSLANKIARHKDFNQNKQIKILLYHTFSSLSGIIDSWDLWGVKPYMDTFWNMNNHDLAKDLDQYANVKIHAISSTRDELLGSSIFSYNSSKCITKEHSESHLNISCNDI